MVIIIVIITFFPTPQNSLPLEISDITISTTYGTPVDFVSGTVQIPAN